jgi:hypothetical protein
VRTNDNTGAVQQSNVNMVSKYQRKLRAKYQQIYRNDKFMHVFFLILTFLSRIIRPLSDFLIP